MAMLVCKRFAKGPNCSDTRLETTDAEQEDCITRALIKCTMNLYSCLAGKYDKQRCLDSETKEFSVPTCLHELDCFDDECRKDLLECYCTGLTGLTCTVCPDVFPDDEVDDPDPTTETFKLKPVGLTVSSADIPIPIVFGRVIVGGNIIWAGNSRKETVTTRTVVGSQVDWTIEEIGFVDIALGLSAGEVEAIGRIWIADTLVVDNTLEFLAETNTTLNRQYYNLGTNTEFHKGSEAEKLFTNMASAEGFGRTPAHRGMSVLMLRRFPIFASASQMPVIRVELYSQIDRAISAFETTTAQTIDDNSISVDPVSARTLVLDGDVMKVYDHTSMTHVNTITAPDPIDRGFFTEEGNIVIQYDDTTRYIFGYNHADYVEATGTPTLGDWGSVVAHDAENGPHNVLVFVSEEFIHYYKADQYNHTLTLLETRENATGATYRKLLVDDFGFQSSASVNRLGMAYSDDLEDIYITAIPLDSRDNLNFFEPDDISEEFQYIFAGASLGGSRLEIIDAFQDTEGHAVVKMVQDVDDTTIKHFVKSFVDPYQASWNIRVTEFPDNFGSFLKFRQYVSREYTYIAPSGVVYRLDLDDGLVSTVGSLDDYSAPAPTGPQYYDAAKGFILYISDGQLVKLYPSRYAGQDATVADVLQRTLEAVGIDAAFIDVSAVTGITMDGYIIQDQTAQAVVLEMMEFFHLSGVDSGGKLTFRPLGTFSDIDIPSDEVHSISNVRASLDVDAVSTVEVKYFDLERGGQPFTQVVTRDFMEQFDDFVSNEGAFQYGANIFTNSDVARVSAERALLRLLQRQDSQELFAAPRNLAVEPGDFVNGYRVNEIEIDPSYEIKVAGRSDRADIYDYAAVLDGVTPALEDNSQVDYDSPMRNYVVPFALPPLMDNPPREIIYVGLSQPDTSPAFTPTQIFTRGPVKDFVDAGTVTAEALVGRLVSFPPTTNRFFATDNLNSIVVEFNDVLPGGVLVNRTAAELYESYDTNVLFVGTEVIQYTTAEIHMDGKTVTFTGLMRGRFGTDEFTNDRFVGEPCALYSPDRFVSGPVGWDAGNWNTAIAATYDLIEPSIRRQSEVYFEDQLTRSWPVGGLVMRRQTTGSTGSRGFYFKVRPRSQFKQTLLTATLDELEPTDTFANGGKIALAILTAPYDADLFAEQFPLANYPIDFEQLDVHDNTYIRHVFKSAAGVESLEQGHQYRQSHFFADGGSYNDTLYVVAFNLSGQDIDSPIASFVFPADWPYIDFEVGLHG